MDKIIQDAIDKGGISIQRHYTCPLEQDPNWWNVRAWVLANDKDKTAAELPLLEGLKYRRN